MGKRKLNTPPKITVETRSSNKLVKTMEDFTEAVRNNGNYTSKPVSKANSDNSDLQEDDNSPSTYDLLKKLGSDISLIKNNVSEMKDDIDKLDGQNQRITTIESFVEDTKTTLAKQRETNLAVNNRLDYNEALIKSKQAVLTAVGIIDTTRDNYRKTTRDFLVSIGMVNNAAIFVEINKFGNAQNTVLLSFPTLNLKLELYKHLKKFKGEQSTENKRNFFMDDLLTQKKLQLFKQLRDLKKQEKIYSVYTFRDNIFVKIKDKDEDPKIIRTQNDIDKIMTE